MEYWVAHIRGAEHEHLEQQGFVLLFPYVDDYAFLPVSDANKLYLEREASLKVMFLKSGDTFATVDGEELKKIQETTVGQLIPGTPILVVSGPYANMSGVIRQVSGDKYLCLVESYGDRQYEVELKRAEIIDKGDEER